MPLLYNWHRDNHRRDLQTGPGFELNSKNKALHDIDDGDVLWAFTRNTGGDYVLALRLVISSRVRNHPSHRYGRYKVVGRADTAEYFETERAPSVETLVRSLSLPVRARKLGHSFMGPAHVRRISHADHAILAVFARDLQRVEPFAAEGQGRGDWAAEAPPQSWSGPAGMLGHQVAVRREVLRELSHRDRQLVLRLREIYDHRCQLCGWRGQDDHGVDVAEAHHLRWLSRGGPDTLDNLALLCPNHHRVVHKSNAAFDYEDGAFVVGGKREPLQFDVHLGVGSG